MSVLYITRITRVKTRLTTVCCDNFLLLVNFQTNWHDDWWETERERRKKEEEKLTMWEIDTRKNDFQLLRQKIPDFIFLHEPQEKKCNIEWMLLLMLLPWPPLLPCVKFWRMRGGKIWGYKKNRLEFPFNQFWQIESVLYVVCYDSTVACLGSRLESK